MSDYTILLFIGGFLVSILSGGRFGYLLAPGQKSGNAAWCIFTGIFGFAMLMASWFRAHLGL